MKRLGLYILNSLTALSLVAGAALWAQSYWSGAQLGYSTPETRYTLRSEHGRFRLTTPPAPAGITGETYFEGECRLLRNQDIEWRDDPDPTCGRSFNPSPRYQSSAHRLWYFAADTNRTTLHRPLLRALDDPDRFVAAHCLLALGVLERSVPISRRPEGVLSGDWHGLHVDLLPTRDRVIPLENGGEMFWHRLPESCRIDPADLPAIRRMWHDRYDADVASLPWWGIVPLFLALPAARAGVWLRRAQRRRQGRCPACGYDMRATPDRCPECGKIPTDVKA